MAADAVELDVRPTAEGELVVAHDRLPAVTLAELRARHPDVPTLADVFDLGAGRIGVAVELEPIGRTLAALEEHGLEPETVILLCFELRPLERLRRLRPDLRTVLHSAGAPTRRRPPASRVSASPTARRAQARSAGRSRSAWRPRCTP